MVLTVGPEMCLLTGPHSGSALKASDLGSALPVPESRFAVRPD